MQRDRRSAGPDVSSYDINGIKSQFPGSFNFDTYNINLGWAGVGQFEDQVNPLSHDGVHGRDCRRR